MTVAPIQTWSKKGGFGNINLSYYSDGTPMVKGIFYDNETLVVRAKRFEDFIAAMAFAESSALAGHRIKRLVLPFVPGARQDRQNLGGGDVLFTAKFVALLVRMQLFDEIVILDPHSQVIVDELKASVRHVTVFGVDHVVPQIDASRYKGIIAPDKGSKARAEAAAEQMNLPIFYGGKVRDTRTGALTGFSLEPLDNQPSDCYLVVDDICDGGGTFLGLAKEIEKQGANADLYVSHGLFSKGTRYLSQAFGRIYTTDSLGADPIPHVHVLPIVKDMV